MAEHKFVKLVSSDGFEFIVLHEAALISGTLKGMLQGQGQGRFQESVDNRVTLESINAVLLEKVCEYLYFHLRYKDAKEVPEFDIAPEMALNLLVAADFLDL